MSATMLSVDPGEHCGWALWVDGHLDQHGAIDGSTAVEPARLVGEFNPGAIVSEDWHIPRRIRQGHTGLKTYAHRAEIWKTLAEAADCELLIVAPASWRAWANRAVDGEPIPPGQKTAAHHRAIIAKAANVARLEGCSDVIAKDEADAILIGAWAISNNLVSGS